MYLTVAFRGDDGPSTYTARVPENLHKVVMAHASKGRRIAFFTDNKHSMGHVFFGEEAHLEIKRQIDAGERPANWGNPNSPNWEAWKKLQAGVRSKDVGEESWGFAKVLKGNPPYLGFKEVNDEE